LCPPHPPRLPSVPSSERSALVLLPQRQPISYPTPAGCGTLPRVPKPCRADDDDDSMGHDGNGKYRCSTQAARNAHPPGRHCITGARGKWKGASPGCLR
jgi:hypothetical protein